MKKLALLFVISLSFGCGEPISPKKSNGSTNGTNGSANAASNNANGSTNGGTNGGTNTANGTTGPNAMTTNGGPGPTCDILTSETNADYCNLQATCDGESLLAECLLDEVWLCYCGLEEPIEVAENPCGDPDASAPLLAGACQTTSTATMSACESTAFDEPDFDCAYGVLCADEHEYAVACINDEGTETSECVCYVDGEPSQNFTADGLTCRVGNDDLSWWNSGCGWNLSR